MAEQHETGRPAAGGYQDTLRQIAESVSEIFWVLDPAASRILYVNPAYERITGRTVETLYRDPGSWREIVHPDDLPRIEEIGRLREHDVEFRIIRPDGGVRWLWARGARAREGEGRRIVGVANDITSRKRAEQQLELSLSLLRATLDATTDGILALDLDGRITAFNRRFVELWKVPDSIAIEAGHEDELSDWLIEQLRDPEAFRAEMARVNQHPETNSFDVVEFKDGRVFERYSQPQRIADDLVGRVWSFRDTTARTNAERALRHRTRRLEFQNEVLLHLARRRISDLADRQAAFQRITEVGADLLETERAGVWLFETGHSRIRLCDVYRRSARRHSSGTVLVRDLAPAYFAAVEKERAIAVDNVHRDDRTRELAHPYCAPLGITSMLDAPIRAAGKMMGIVCFEQVGPPRSWTVEDRNFAASVADLASIAIEATEREQAEARLRFLAHGSSTLASSIDYRTTLANAARLAVPSFADWCVLDAVEDGAVRRRIAAYREGDDDSAVRDFERDAEPHSPRPARRALETGEPQLVTDLHERGGDGDERDPYPIEPIRRLGVRSYIAAPLGTRDRALGVIVFGCAGRNYDPDDVVFARDIATRAAVAIDNARLHERAYEASKAKSDFLAVMSHELRTPLTAILGYTELMEEEVRGRVNAEQRQQLQRIRLRSQDLLRLLEEILEFSRTETGRERRGVQEVDLSRLLAEVSAVARPLADERGLSFELNRPERPGTLYTDAAKVKHILLNLLSNAVKFTERGGIRLDVSRDGADVVFRVSDTGQGIAPKDQQRIFEPFVQVEDAMTREKGGTGLGLAVVRRLTHLLGGDVSLDSEPGVGSTFTVRLPADARDEREPGESRAA